CLAIIMSSAAITFVRMAQSATIAFVRPTFARFPAVLRPGSTSLGNGKSLPASPAGFPIAAPFDPSQATEFSPEPSQARSKSWPCPANAGDCIAPTVALILIRTNDIGWLHRTAADTSVGIDAVVAELHLRLPATQILLMGLLPSDRGTWVPQATGE